MELGLPRVQLITMFPGLFFFKRLHVREAYIPDTRIPHTRKPERLLIRMIFTAVINHN